MKTQRARKESRIKAVAFDFDGTLLDSIPFIHKAIRRIFHEAGIHEYSIQHYYRHSYLHLGDYLRRFGVRMPAVEFFRLYDEEMRWVNPDLFRDTVFVLKELRARDIRLALISANFRNVVINKLEIEGIADFFDLIECPIESKREALRRFCDCYDFKRKEVFFVGDMQSDIREGRAARIPTVGLISPHDQDQSILRAQPNYSVNTLTEILSLLQKETPSS